MFAEAMVVSYVDLAALLKQSYILYRHRMRLVSSNDRQTRADVE